jgi:septal ring factor EnvC (AmiA/AmiB activator)
MADDNTDNTASANHSMPDPFALAIGLCQIAANAKAIEPALKRLRKLGRDIAKAEQQLAAVSAAAEQKQTELDARAAALDERGRALDARTTEFDSSLQEARDELHNHHRHVEQEDKRLRHRVMAHADLLSGYNPQLQDLPSWEVLKRLVVGLPDDPPPLEREVAHPRIDVFSDTSNDPNADRHGNVFLGTLSRDLSHRGAQ